MLRRGIPSLQRVPEMPQTATVLGMSNEMEIALQPIDAGRTLVVDVYLDGNFPPDTALVFALHAADTNERLGYVEQIPGIVDYKCRGASVQDTYPCATFA